MIAPTAEEVATNRAAIENLLKVVAVVLEKIDNESARWVIKDTMESGWMDATDQASELAQLARDFYPTHQNQQ